MHRTDSILQMFSSFISYYMYDTLITEYRGNVDNVNIMVFEK